MNQSLGVEEVREFSVSLSLMMGEMCLSPGYEVLLYNPKYILNYVCFYQFLIVQIILFIYFRFDYCERMASLTPDCYGAMKVIMIINHSTVFGMFTPFKL